MSVSHRVRAACSCLLALAFMLAMSGCEDLQARTDAKAAQQAIDQLKAELNAVKVQNQQLIDALRGIPEKLAAQITERTDKVSDQVMGTSKDLLDKMAKDSEQTRTAATSVVQSARGDFDKELQATKAAVAADVQKLREENKAAVEDLKKFMDNQLRELYPYAYQPRRESKAPPEADTKN